MTADHQEDPHRGWNVKLRLAIDADNADEARAIAEEVWRKMAVTAGAEPQIIRSDGRVPHWNVITDLDLSALESITPDDAVTRFRYVIRNLPGAVFTGTAADDRRTGLWQWLPDSWELAWQDQELAHPAVRAAGIRIVVMTTKNRYPKPSSRPFRSAARTGVCRSSAGAIKARPGSLRAVRYRRCRQRRGRGHGLIRTGLDAGPWNCGSGGWGFEPPRPPSAPGVGVGGQVSGGARVRTRS